MRNVFFILLIVFLLAFSGCAAKKETADTGEEAEISKEEAASSPSAEEATVESATEDLTDLSKDLEGLGEDLS